MRYLVLLSALLCGCDRWVSCEELTDWAIPVTREGTTDEGAEAFATRGSDGTLYLVVADPFTTVRLGDQLLDGPHLVSISPEGIIETVAAVTAVGSRYVGAVRADGAGNVVVLWNGESSAVTSYDASFEERWSHAIGTGFDWPLELGPDGQVGFATSSMDGSSLVYLDADGTTRWEVAPEDYFVALQFADNGDLFGFSQARRVRFAAASGTRIDEIATPAPPEVTLPDGGFVTMRYGPDDGGSVVVSRYDAAGGEVWSHTRAVRWLGNLLVTSTGDLVAQTSYEVHGGPSYALLVLDGDTGAELDEVRMCSHVSVFAADRDRYFALGLIGSPSVGLARFPIP